MENPVQTPEKPVLTANIWLCIIAVAIIVIGNVAVGLYDMYKAKQKHPDSTTADFSVAQSYVMHNGVNIIVPENKAKGYGRLEWELIGNYRYLPSNDVNPSFEVDTPGIYLLRLTAYPYKNKGDNKSGWCSHKDQWIIISHE